jgi:hypothetical protein
MSRVATRGMTPLAPTPCAVVLVLLAAGIICGLAVPLVAQGAGTQPRPGVPVERVEINAPEEIIATGCLAKDGDGYLLRNAAILVRPWLAPGLTPDVIGAPKPMPTKTVFRLMHREGLEAHVGHTVEMVGVVQPQTANVPPSPDTIVRTGTGPGTATAPAAAGGPATGGQQNSQAPRFVPRLNNPELDNKPPKMISASCS